MYVCMHVCKRLRWQFWCISCESSSGEDSPYEGFSGENSP